MTQMTMIPRVAPKARRYVAEVLDFGFHNGSSPGLAARLEEQFAAKFQRRFGILHANGTTTMHSALLAAGVGVGDEVIVPAYTVAMTGTAALYANAVPVFADVDPETWTIDPHDVARCFEDVVARCDWLVPQKVPAGYASSYWTYTVRIARDDLDWAALRRKFVELGGDGFYGAYLPVYREPVFRRLSEAVAAEPGRYPQFAGVLPDYREVRCPVWESIQPRVVQLKTNYFDLETAERQAEILGNTIRCLP